MRGHGKEGSLLLGCQEGKIKKGLLEEEMFEVDLERCPV